MVADTGNHRVLAFGGTGYEQLSSPASSCAYGVACTVRLFGAVTMAARNRWAIGRALFDRGLFDMFDEVMPFQQFV